MKKIKSQIKEHLRDTHKRHRLLKVSAVFFAGLILGLTWAIARTPRYATGQEIEDARRVIAEQFINESTVECNDSSDPISPSGRIVVFYKYLRVNRYANRAVIRGCNNIDSLLALGKDGKWTRTNVNMSLDTRVNIRWQNACNIADITIADDEVRPENSSIDETNFQLCRALR